jgi:hypothetical protein
MSKQNFCFGMATSNYWVTNFGSKSIVDLKSEDLGSQPYSPSCHSRGLGISYLLGIFIHLVIHSAVFHWEPAVYIISLNQGRTSQSMQLFSQFIILEMKKNHIFVPFLMSTPFSFQTSFPGFLTFETVSVIYPSWSLRLHESVKGNQLEWNFRVGREMRDGLIHLHSDEDSPQRSQTREWEATGISRIPPSILF